MTSVTLSSTELEATTTNSTADNTVALLSPTRNIKSPTLVLYNPIDSPSGRKEMENEKLAIIESAKSGPVDGVFRVQNMHNVTTLPENLHTYFTTSMPHTIRFEHNYNLSVVPEGLLTPFAPKLEELHITYNILTRVPDSVIMLTRLKVLNLSNNQLRYLPFDIDRLKNLEVLDVQSNFITAFPSEISYLRKLRRLYVQNNPLVDEDDPTPYAAYRPPEVEVCTLCRLPLPVPPTGEEVLMNFVDLAQNKSIPVAYFLCSEKCKRMGREVMDAEFMNYSKLQYDVENDVYD
eukprot:PhF_6_TR14100/c0_g1_i3/m.22533